MYNNMFQIVQQEFYTLIVLNPTFCDILEIIVEPNWSQIHLVTDIPHVLFITLHVACKLRIWVISAIFASERWSRRENL